MKFLNAYVDKFEPPAKKFMVTKRKSEKAQMNDMDLLNNDIGLVKKDSLQ